MAIEDWIDGTEPQDFDEETEQRCKFCGERDLWWAKVNGRWILVDTEERAHAPHCTGQAAKQWEFPKLED